jgi:hypothetical protein
VRQGTSSFESSSGLKRLSPEVFKPFAEPGAVFLVVGKLRQHRQELRAHLFREHFPGVCEVCEGYFCLHWLASGLIGLDGNAPVP